jgi:hypothetical protein
MLGLLLVPLACISPTTLSVPDSTDLNRFNGVTYERIVKDSPRLMVIHIVTIELKANGIKALVTPGNPESDQPLTARTTSEFLRAHDLQIAINGSGFTPWYDLGPLGYSPKTGAPVTPFGFAASRGTIYAQDTDEEPTLYIYQTNKASIEHLIGKIYNAVSGTHWLVKNGNIVAGLDSEPQPRTALGLNRSGNKLIIIVVDGRQEGYSGGATLEEIAQLLKERGVIRGMNMDGGGSTTLVMEDKNGDPLVVNSPIHQGVPGNERPVANHLGIFAKEK